MRTTTLLTAILLLSAVGPATVAATAAEDLRERNRAHLLEDLDHEIPGETTATLVTNEGTETVPAREALEALLDHLDQAQIDLQERSEAAGATTIPTAAGQESFPLAGTSGDIFEHQSGGGLLPATCEEVKLHDAQEGTLSSLDPVFTQPRDGFVTSTLSESVAVSQAAMVDDTGTLDDTVTGYEGAILAGPNHATTCVDFEFCSWAGCFHSITHVTTLSTGFVTDGDAAQLVHEEEPVPSVGD